jgi:hypothetical protein
MRIAARLFSARPPVDRLRYARMVPPPRRMQTAPVPRTGLAPPTRRGTSPPPRIPGPAYLPEIIALEMLEERRAANVAASTTIPAMPPAPVTPTSAPEPEVVSPRALLGW